MIEFIAGLVCGWLLIVGYFVLHPSFWRGVRIGRAEKRLKGRQLTPREVFEAIDRDREA